MDQPLRYEDRNMGISDDERRSLRERMIVAHTNVEKLRRSKEQGFLDLPFEKEASEVALRVARLVQKHFREVIVIGIGGSDLGSRTIWQALGGEKARMIFVSNPDPETVSSVLRSTDWPKTAMVVISKSGTTLETMAVFMAMRESLIKAVGKERHASHVIAVTETSQASTLFQIARAERYEVVPHPQNVGGRFSVLSTVGLLPAAIGGVNVRRLLNGARQAESERRRNKADSISARYAANQYLALTKRGQHVQVVMPYADSLSQFGQWYRQLWAESLGKRRGNACVGPTPIAAVGAIDQHSQIQLYADGPNDKTITFIDVKKFRRSVRAPNAWREQPGIEYVGGLSFEEILHAERSGTEHALTTAGRPNGTIYIPKITPESLGALFVTFEAAAAYFAELLGINAYDQPGVEEGKRETKRLLI